MWSRPTESNETSQQQFLDPGGKNAVNIFTAIGPALFFLAYVNKNSQMRRQTSIS